MAVDRECCLLRSILLSEKFLTVGRMWQARCWRFSPLRFLPLTLRVPDTCLFRFSRKQLAEKHCIDLLLLRIFDMTVPTAHPHVKIAKVVSGLSQSKIGKRIHQDDLKWNWRAEAKFFNDILSGETGPKACIQKWVETEASTVFSSATLGVVKIAPQILMRCQRELSSVKIK